jgi:hypothetical protein
MLFEQSSSLEPQNDAIFEQSLLMNILNSPAPSNMLNSAAGLGMSATSSSAGSGRGLGIVAMMSANSLSNQNDDELFEAQLAVL